MKRALLCAVVLATCLVPAPALASEDLSACNAVELRDRPKLGQSGSWDSRRYQRRHNEYQREHPDVFAGGYLSGKHFYVGFTQDVCAHLQRFRRGVPKKWRVRAFQAEWTYREMRRAQACVNDYFDDRWLGISATGVDVWRNKLEVMLKKNTERRRRFVERHCGTVDIRFTEGEVTTD